jgi:hypothetical protein
MNAKSLPPTREATLAEAHATVTELTEAIDARPPGRVLAAPVLAPARCRTQAREVMRCPRSSRHKGDADPREQ